MEDSLFSFLKGSYDELSSLESLTKGRYFHSVRFGNLNRDGMFIVVVVSTRVELHNGSDSAELQWSNANGGHQDPE